MELPRLGLPAEAADRMLMTSVLVEFYEFDTSPSQVTKRARACSLDSVSRYCNRSFDALAVNFWRLTLAVPVYLCLFQVLRSGLAGALVTETRSPCFSRGPPCL